MSGTLNFFETPRAVGNPIQHIVKSETEEIKFINANYGRAPVFISHNAYPTLINTPRGTEEPYQINVSKLFLDFDSDRKPENAQLDAIHVLDFCEKENLPILPVFSGSKGFHTYIALKSETYVYSQFLRDATKAIHLWLKKELGLRTIDLKCAEPRRLCRVLYTPHAKIDKETGKLVVNGMYCCPLKPEWVRDWRMEQIMRYAKEPKALDYELTGDFITLDEFLNRFNINIDEMLKLEFADADSSQNVIVEYMPVNDAYVKEILPHPCVHSQIMNNPNPPHFARFAAAAWFAGIGLSRQWVLDFFRERNYVDHKDEICIQQINNIFEHGYKFPSCRKLYANCLCVGAACPKFKGFVKYAGIEVKSPETAVKA